MTDRVTLGQLVDDLSAVIHDAESLLRATASQAGEKVDEARTRAEETVRQAKARLAGIEQEAVDRAREVAGDADRYVRDNPWSSIGIAAGVGLLLGLLISRR